MILTEEQREMLKFWADCPEPEHYLLSYDGADFDQWGDCEFGIHD